MLGRIRTQLWNFLEYPETSIAAQALAFTSLFMVCISTVTFIIGTNHESQQEPNINGDDEDQSYNEIIDNVAVIFFSVEYFLRYEIFCQQ